MPVDFETSAQRGVATGGTLSYLLAVNGPYISRLVLPLAILSVTACQEESGSIVPELQMIAAPEKPYVIDATSAQRFPKYADRSGRYRFIPGGSWARLNGSEFRTLNFAFGPDNVGECYVSELRGFLDGGLENVNRWRGQMGLEPMSAADFAKLPRKPFGGAEAVFVKMDGSFSGMGQGEARPDYRMLAVILMQDCEAFSVKMIGPAFLLDREESEFLAFCETFEIRPNPDAQPYMEAQVGPFEFLRPCDWEYVVPDSDDLVRRPIGFEIGPNQEARCEMGIIVDGDKAGPLAIANGWRQAAGLDPFTEEEFASLSDQVLMGTPGKSMEWESGGTTFLGIVSALASEGHAPMTVISTLQGPTGIVAPQKLMFRAFAETLRLRPAQPSAESPH